MWDKLTKMSLIITGDTIIYISRGDYIMDQEGNKFKKLMTHYVYSSYTFHGVALILAFIGYRLPTVNLEINASYFVLIVFETMFTLIILMTVKNINYKEIRQLLTPKVITMLKFKNKISDGERSINTIVSTTVNIVVLNIALYVSLFLNLQFTYLLYLLIVYVFMLLIFVSSLHRQMARARIEKK